MAFLVSRWEVFGYAAVEALGQLTPVIVTRQVPVAEYVERVSSGWVCDSDTDSIAAAFHEAVKLGKAGLKAMGRNAADVDGGCSPVEIAQQVCGVYAGHAAGL